MQIECIPRSCPYDACQGLYSALGVNAIPILHSRMDHSFEIITLVLIKGLS